MSDEFERILTFLDEVKSGKYGEINIPEGSSWVEPLDCIDEEEDPSFNLAWSTI